MNNNTEYAALILRVGLGAMFLAHGLLKRSSTRSGSRAGQPTS